MDKTNVIETALMLNKFRDRLNKEREHEAELLRKVLGPGTCVFQSSIAVPTDAIYHHSSLELKRDDYGKYRWREKK